MLVSQVSQASGIFGCWRYGSVGGQKLKLDAYVYVYITYIIYINDADVHYQINMG